jgi:hypothetical protein
MPHEDILWDKDSSSDLGLQHGLLIGGYNRVTWLSSLDFFSPEKDILVGLAPMTSPSSYASVAALDDHIFAFGGEEKKGNFCSFEKYGMDSLNGNLLSLGCFC